VPDTVGEVLRKTARQYENQTAAKLLVDFVEYKVRSTKIIQHLMPKHANLSPRQSAHLSNVSAHFDSVSMTITATTDIGLFTGVTEQEKPIKRSSADAEIARRGDYCRRGVQSSNNIPYPTGFSQTNSKSQDKPRHRPIPSRADFYFLMHYVITIHQRCRQTDGRTDVMLVA